MKPSAFIAAAALTAVFLPMTMAEGDQPTGRERVVRLPGAIEFKNPDQKSWEWTSGVRCLMYSPRAIALLIDAKRDAIIRFHLLSADDHPPGEVTAAHVRAFKRDGWQFFAFRPCDPRALAYVMFSDGKPGGIRGKLVARLLPGNPKLTVLTIGFWHESGKAAASKDFDTAANSVKWCPRDK